MHDAPRGYGGKGDRWVEAVSQALEEHQFKSLLDYGAGQNKLISALIEMGWEDDVVLEAYDPAIPELAVAPMKHYQAVVCTDVLEHVELDRLDAVLDHLALITRDYLLVSIGLELCGKSLPDGRNAHITLLDRDEWVDRLRKRFPWPEWQFKSMARAGYLHKHLDLALIRNPQ